jgi:alpha-galactosidase
MNIMEGITVLRQPSHIRVQTEDGQHMIRSRSRDNVWRHKDVSVMTSIKDGMLKISLGSESTPVLQLQLRWQQRIPENRRFLGDHWERSYGDMAWTSMFPDKPMPWYFLTFDGSQIYGHGVKTGAGAFCHWYVDPFGVSLIMDVRSGGVGVELKGRVLELATVVEYSPRAGETLYENACNFVSRLCDKPLMPKQPIYGAGNSYYAYGHSSQDQILDDSKLLSDLSGNKTNLPFSLIDMGWENPRNGNLSNWRAGNERFPDMGRLADKIKKLGTRPGIWYRPLLSHEGVPESWILPYREDFTTGEGKCILDPTVPEVQKQIEDDVKLMTSKWGYELIKYDGTTHDILGRWGKAMSEGVTDEGWQFSDKSRTNAEVLINLYRLIHKAAGQALLMGCNTVGHLCAGHVHVQRIGDNTSGKEWTITRKMGVNSLAFRALQHGAFFAVDADCVGLSNQIPWKLNQQWLDLLAASGTTLFVSADASYIKDKQKAALQVAYDRASRPQPLVQPLDWINNSCPTRWKAGEEFLEFNWWAA